MPRKTASRGSARRMNALVRDLVEQITRTVAQEMETRLPGREEVRDLDRKVQSLSRRIQSLARRSPGKRAGRPPIHRTCEVAGCDLPHVARGFCSRHYQAWRRRKRDGNGPEGRPARSGKTRSP